MFIDEARIKVRGGRGGDGCTSFHREKFRPLGGPDGGDGGKGGSVIVRASEGVNTLVEYTRKKHFRAGDGSGGSGNNRRGMDGKDLVILVPVGTQVREEGGKLLADLSIPGREVVVAAGGRGGRGNASFATPARRAPDFSERGEAGEERWIQLELKLLADVGVVGLPNAGKSTLVSRLSAARPRIADYPFTTLEPVLGVVRVDEERSFVISDLPGLVEGAHQGRGLGLRFLRHVERTSVILHLLDLSCHAPVGPAQALEIMLEELSSYGAGLMERHHLVAGSKLDVADPSRLAEAREAAAVRGWDFFPISSVSGEGLPDLVRRLAGLVQESRAQRADMLPRERTLYAYDPERERGFRVFRCGEEFHVEGKRVERLLKSMDLSNPQALSYLQARMKRMGVEEELARHGAKEGDTVVIAGYVFDFLPES